MPTEVEFKREYAAKRALDVAPIKAANETFSPYGCDFNFISWIAKTWEMDDEVRAFVKEERNRQPTLEEQLADLRIRAKTASDSEAHKYYLQIAQIQKWINKEAEKNNQQAKQLNEELDKQLSDHDLLADIAPMRPKVEE